MADNSGTLGLLSYNTASRIQMPEPERKKPSPDMDRRKMLDDTARLVGDELGNQLQDRYNNWVEARRWIEEDWIKYIRAYHGVYEGDVLSRIGPNQSKVFVQLTRMKTDTSYNRICDLELGPEEHWDVKPSPMPDVDPIRREELKMQIMQAMMVDPMLGGMSQGEPTEEEMDDVEEEVAKKACKRMRLKIKDQLEYARYRKHFRQCVFEICVLGTGVFKGPMVGVDTRQRWVRMKKLGDPEAVKVDEAQEFEWKLTDKREVLPKLSTPSLFDVFPDPFTDETEHGLGVFERHVLLHHQLEELAKQPFFIAEAIADLRQKYPTGNHWDNYTDIELRFVSGQNTGTENEHRYDVIEYWGWVTGAELMKAGLKGVDEYKSYYCNVWHCGGITIKATVSPAQPTRCLYKLIPYKEVIASQYGVGVPYLMKDSQETVNAAARELINNAALSSGPQVEVSVDLIELDSNESVRDIYPWRTWVRSGGDLAYPAVRFTNIPNTTESMAKIIQIWRAFADEETNIPSYSHGSEAISGAAGKTASGMSMMMGAASLDIKGVVKNIDQYLVKPFIEEMYHFNMQWSDDESIKGDMECEAVGSTNLLAKEIKSQRVVMLLQMTNNPTDTQIMGLPNRARLLRAAGEAMDIDPDDMAPDPDDMPDENMQPGMGMDMPVPGGAPGSGGMGPGAGPAPAGPQAQPTGGGAPAAQGVGVPAAQGADMTPGGPGMAQGQAPVAPSVRT